MIETLPIKKLITHLKFLQDSSSKTCQYLSRKEISKIQLFCLGLLRRIDDMTSTTRVLFQLLQKNHKHEFSIGIMFRALVLDTLIIMNLYKLIKEVESNNISSEEQEEIVNDFCCEFLSDGLNKVIKDIEHAETLHLRTKENTKYDFKNIGIQYEPFFDSYAGDGTKPKLKYPSKTNITATGLFKTLASEDKLIGVSNIYYIYQYLSKYDHFGIVYYKLINENLETKMKIYTDATEVLVAHNACVHEVLERFSLNDVFINKQTVATNNYLLKHVIDQNNS